MIEFHFVLKVLAEQHEWSTPVACISSNVGMSSHKVTWPQIAFRLCHLGVLLHCLSFVTKRLGNFSSHSMVSGNGKVSRLFKKHVPFNVDLKGGSENESAGQHANTTNPSSKTLMFYPLNRWRGFCTEMGETQQKRTILMSSKTHYEISMSARSCVSFYLCVQLTFWSPTALLCASCDYQKQWACCTWTIHCCWVDQNTKDGHNPTKQSPSTCALLCFESDLSRHDTPIRYEVKASTSSTSRQTATNFQMNASPWYFVNLGTRLLAS